MRSRNRILACALAWCLLVGAAVTFAAAERYGRVTFSGLAVPGATVTATQGDKKFATVSDQNGIYRFADLGDGAWTIRIEMAGFATIEQETTFAGDVQPPTWELKLLPFEEITRGLVAATPSEGARAGVPAPAAGSQQGAPGDPANPAAAGSRAAAAGAGSRSTPGGFQRAGVSASPGGSAAPTPAPPGSPALPPAPGGPTAPDDPSAPSAADGFLINGSVNNGAASPFAQSAAFGNNRPGSRSLYNGGIGTILGNSAWDARPFSFTGQQAPKPAYTDVQFLGTFGGPFKIPGVRNRPTVFFGYQRSADHNANTQSALMPTLLERGGDFSETRDAFGRPVQIIDPATGLPFTGNVIPRDRITPQAAALLGYYPEPNAGANSVPGRYNYQRPALTGTRQDSVQARVTHSLNGRNQIFGTFAYQRTATDTTGVFGFADTSTVSGIDTTAGWSHRFSMFFSLRLRYQFTRQTTRSTPYFANRTNVSGDAGVRGNNQDPVNWGPPTLIFSSGLQGLADSQYALNHSRTNAWNAEGLWNHGRHNVTMGGDVRLQQFNVLAQQDARGTLAFTGSATGSDLADFLLGIPKTSSIAFGNPDKYLRSAAYDAYVNNDWRLTPALTINAGLRWEYETPFTERFGRLANLDIAPGFAAIATVAANSPIGTLTGTHYPDSLIHPDRSGLQPRIGAAWRPVPGSSLVIRGGYGIYRNTAVYQSIALLLAQQPPFSQAASVENGPEHPLTLANAFAPSPGAATNTFAIDPDFRVGLAQNWQVSAQRDLPASLTIMGTYLGTRGSRLMQELLPNTYPSGAATPCASCPAGFVYLTSNGRSTRHSGQLQVRRRLRNGLTATAQYTLSNAKDDAGAFTGVSLTGAAIAQDWLNPNAEWGPSNFDQRHLLTAQFQYTTGIGVSGGALLDGLKGSLVKGWTVTSQLTAGSGLPVTPVYLTSVSGTGVTGTIRADLVGPSIEAPAGYYVNPAAYTPPEPGHWGTAGRNSLRGPAQFSLNAGIARTFTLGERLNLDWRIDATNVLNRVTFASINTIVGSPQFGLPNRANTLRKVQSTLRLRF